MTKVNLEGLPHAVAGLHEKLDVIHRLLLSQSNISQPVSEPHPEWDYLPSIVALSQFLECSYRTANRIKKAGLIKLTQEGTKVKFLISDVLHAIEKHDRVGKYIDRLCEKYPPAGAPPKPQKEHKIFIESELYDEFMFIDIKYRGFKCLACCSADLWDKQSEIKSLVNLIIERQNQRKPFKVSPL